MSENTKRPPKARSSTRKCKRGCAFAPLPEDAFTFFEVKVDTYSVLQNIPGAPEEWQISPSNVVIEPSELNNNQIEILDETPQLNLGDGHGAFIAKLLDPVKLTLINPENHNNKWSHIFPVDYPIVVEIRRVPGKPGVKNRKIKIYAQPIQSIANKISVFAPSPLTNYTLKNYVNKKGLKQPIISQNTTPHITKKKTYFGGKSRKVYKKK